MTMKKSIIILLALAMTLAMFAGCGGKTAETSAEPSAETSAAPVSPAAQVSVNVAGLAGPSSIGMIKMISEKALNSEAYAVNYSVAAAPDELTAKLISGEVQLAALPTNSAAVLYNKTGGQVQFLALNTLGVLYLVGKDASITSLKDLAGKTVTLSGSGAVPEYAVQYILDKAGIKDQVTLNFLPDHASVAQALLGGNADLVILPQPFVTQVTTKNPELKILADVTKDWNEASGGESVLSMGCLVVNTAFASENPQFISDFLTQYEASVKFVNDNPAQAAKLVSEAGIIADAAVTEKAIPFCNIVYKSAQDSKAEISAFLQALYDLNPASVGGKLPDDGFYYAQNNA